MAPERFRGRATPGRHLRAGADPLRAAGLRPAFDATDRPADPAGHAGATRPRPRQLDAAVPRDLETIVLKAIDEDPGSGTRRPRRWPRTCGGSSRTGRSSAASASVRGPGDGAGGNPAVAGWSAGSGWASCWDGASQHRCPGHRGAARGGRQTPQASRRRLRRRPTARNSTWQRPAERAGTGPGAPEDPSRQDLISAASSGTAGGAA